MIKRNIEPIQANIEQILPKRTKEQKVVAKALQILKIILHSNTIKEKAVKCKMAYAVGLLESLLFMGDEEE